MNFDRHENATVKMHKTAREFLLKTTENIFLLLLTFKSDSSIMAAELSVQRLFSKSAK